MNILLRKIVGIILLVLGVFLLFALLFSLVTVINNIVYGLYETTSNEAYPAVYFFERFIGYGLFGLLDWILIKYGIQLLLKKRVKINQTEILDVDN